MKVIFVVRNLSEKDNDALRRITSFLELSDNEIIVCDINKENPFSVFNTQESIFGFVCFGRASSIFTQEWLSGHPELISVIFREYRDISVFTRNDISYKKSISEDIEKLHQEIKTKRSFSPAQKREVEISLEEIKSLIPKEIQGRILVKDRQGSIFEIVNEISSEEQWPQITINDLLILSLVKEVFGTEISTATIKGKRND